MLVILVDLQIFLPTDKSHCDKDTTSAIGLGKVLSETEVTVEDDQSRHERILSQTVA